MLGVFVTAANLDREGLLDVIEKAKSVLSRVQIIWADGGYTGKFLIPNMRCRVEGCQKKR